jgi:hypothetical protein
MMVELYQRVGRVREDQIIRLGEWVQNNTNYSIYGVLAE